MTTPQPRPKTVEVAFWLSAGIAVVAFVVFGVVFSALHIVSSLIGASDEVETVPPGGRREFIEDVMGGSILLSLVVSVVVGGLVLTTVAMMRSGRNWARVAVTVLIVAGLGWLATSGHGVDLRSPSAFALVTALANVVVVVLLYVPQSNRYFARPKA
ncbi:hypothetical protein [Allokutzneria oryzae]|uniref:DUF2127 domain-containing protein n=1 Tax=Allokutzneria oryzae TaxID=1378989 RepID=A0ABV5ZWG3_9PSEU